MNKQMVYLLITLGVCTGLLIGLILAHLMLSNTAPQSSTKDFDQNFAAMGTWLENYKRENPTATKEETQHAFEAAWKTHGED